MEHSFEYDKVLIDLVYALNKRPYSDGYYSTVNSDLLRVNFSLLRANFALLRANVANALLTVNVALLKFMDCVLDFQIQIYLHTHVSHTTYVVCVNFIQEWWGTRV